MEEGQQQTPAEQPQPSPGLSHRKVIQPLRPIIDEMKAAQPTLPSQPQPTASVSGATSGFGVSQQLTPQTTDQVSPLITDSQHPVASQDSTYPQASSGVSAFSNALPPTMEVSGQEPEWKSPKNHAKVMTVRAVAGIIILLNAINAYDWLLEKQAGYTNWVNALAICVMLALAVGTFRLREGARFLFVVVSAISLVLSCIGLFTFYAATHQSAVAVSSYGSKALTKAQLESSLKAVEDNTSLPARQRQEAIRQTQDNINNLQDSTSELKVKQYLSTGVLVVTAIGPLIFFTRPSIKEVFN
jgi:hypothetical protein